MRSWSSSPGQAKHDTFVSSWRTGDRALRQQNRFGIRVTILSVAARITLQN
jgi:hypothetical protein